MPKIIENLQRRLVEEAKVQAEMLGYSAVTIRSVASACGVGVGTVYNYFPSKDDLLAAYMLEDWKTCVAVIQEISRKATDPELVLQCMYDQLTAYARRHKNILYDAAAAAAFAGPFSLYHGLLRSQLAAPLRKFCGDDFTAEFVAESLLTWSMAGKAFPEIFGILKNLF